MHLHDLVFVGPGLLFLDQYFNSFIDEYLVLWIALVSSRRHREARPETTLSRSADINEASPAAEPASSLLQIISFFDLVRYCVSVCNQIACHLHICVFKIKPCSPLTSASH